MKIDLNQLESDHGLNAPPYVTRSTAPRQGHLIHDPAWWEAYNAIAKHEFGLNFNRQLAEVFDV